MSIEAMQHLEVLQRSRLTLHEGADGASVDWSLSAAALRCLASEVRDTSVSAETGCGLSTILLGSSASEHHCFTLLDTERIRISETADRLGLSLRNVQFHIGDSIATLASSALPPLDIAVVDGGHAFPYPTADWLFLARPLRTGGLLGIDDSWIPSVRSLTRFLDRESEWHRLSADGRTNWYRRAAADTTPSVYPDRWDVQGINRRTAAHFVAMQDLDGEEGLAKVVRHPILSGRRALGGLVPARLRRR